MRVEDRATAVPEPRAGEPCKGVEGICNGRSIRQRQVGNQIALPFETVGKGACQGSERLEPVGRVVAVALGPGGCVGLQQRQASAQPVGVGVTHRVSVPWSVLARQKSAAAVAVHTGSGPIHHVC